MSGSGAPTLEPLNCSGQHVAIVVSTWHDEICTALLDGARRACAAYQVREPEVVRVPGAFELPQMAQFLAERYSTYDAIVALGVVIRGGTPHFEYVCNAVTDGLMRVALDHKTTVGFGVLTCDTEDQARERAGLPGSREDKGYEAAEAALRTAYAMRHIDRGWGQ